MEYVIIIGQSDMRRTFIEICESLGGRQIDRTANQSWNGIPAPCDGAGYRDGFALPTESAAVEFRERVAKKFELFSDRAPGRIRHTPIRECPTGCTWDQADAA